jgi:hypothetical protein
MEGQCGTFSIHAFTDVNFKLTLLTGHTLWHPLHSQSFFSRQLQPFLGFS